MSIIMLLSLGIFIAVGITIALTISKRKRGGQYDQGQSVEEYTNGGGSGFDPAGYGYIPSPRVESIMREGNSIEAIKVIREETRLGLKEAKMLFDYIKLTS